MLSKKRIILGVDPGYGRMGAAVIEKDKSKESLLHSECFETLSSLGHSDRLVLVAKKIETIIDKYLPNELAIETLLFGKNQKTALSVAEARGVIILQAAKKGLKIREFNPNQIKLAVTGYGKSDKKQVISMIPKLVKMDSKKRLDDEYDAIAVALTSAAISISTE